MRSQAAAVSTAVLVFFAISAGMAAEGPAAKADTKQPSVACEMEYTLSGWSAFYKTSKGEGTITCDNGQSADVSIKSTGGGLTFGKSKIHDGHGTFSKVGDISELFGSYAAAEAHAGAAKSASAQAVTKGEVSLAFAGTGSGVDLGIAFSKFTIKKK